MTAVMKQLIQQTASLSADEQLALAAILIEQARRQAHPARRAWLDVVGAAPYPLAGEDAQAWVTRSRQATEETKAAN